MKWTLCIPATRPSVAWMSLWSASMGQSLRPSAVLVMDNGPVSVTAAMEWRFVVDVLVHHGIFVGVQRVLPGPEVNAARMWHRMLSAAKGVVGLCDDDVLWEPEVALRLTEALDEKVGFATALQLTPNNEQDVVGWTAPAFPSAQFGDAPDGQNERVARASGHALFLDTDDYDGMLADWEEPMAYDTALCAHLGDGIRVVQQGCRVWEMAHPENRQWRPNS